MLCGITISTVQKLVNRIKALMPADGNNIINVGPIRLDREHRACAFGKNSRLTPRLITLLQMLMESHGEVGERESLFKKCVGNKL